MMILILGIIINLKKLENEKKLKLIKVNDFVRNDLK